jgi:sulfur-carrier protein adenylyltransferase/sulfurtransferase
MLTPDQKQRYARHLMLPQIGEAGQERLFGSRVLVVGAGGLGSPVIYYLAAAGVGTLGIADADVVDLSNLQRQILHGTDDVGRSKTDSACESVARLNPDVKVNRITERICPENVMRILDGYDLVVDACDNFPTRYLMNDACVLQKKTYIHGSVFQFEGQTTTFVPGAGPCYRCLFPQPPEPEILPRGNDIGLPGAVPGLIGLIEAVETLKLLLGIGASLSGRLLLFDALKLRFRELNIRRDPECRVCGDNPGIIAIDPCEKSYQPII